MLSNVTPAVAHALKAAQEMAYHAGSPSVQPSHLLHGLLREEEGLAVILLEKAGLDVAAYRRTTPDLNAATTGVGAGVPFGDVTQRALARARQLARECADDRIVTGEQLVVALLREDAAICEQMEGMGLVTSRLESEAAANLAPALDLDEPLDLLGPTEQVDVARILDAGANRAREAMRVLEDYCRFVLDDAFLSRTLKEMRHDLAQTLAGLPPSLLLEARDTLRDVGTTVTTAGEQRRHSPAGVVQANLKRLQEGLRSLEEYGKLYRPQVGQALEALRYRSYTLERALVLGTNSRQRLADARLYVLVTGARCAAALDWTIREAAAGGANVIQLREKELDDRRLLERARQVRRWTREAGVLFIVNDRPDIARLAEADGVHLGQDDQPVKEARRVIGPDALIGVSTHNLDQVRKAVLDGASYLGVGPTFPSGTKEFAELAGPDFVRQASAETSLPAFVLGGVNRNTVGAAVAAGARRVAVSQAVCAADDPRAAAAELRRALDRA